MAKDDDVTINIKHVEVASSDPDRWVQGLTDAKAKKERESERKWLEARYSDTTWTLHENEWHGADASGRRAFSVDVVRTAMRSGFELGLKGMPFPPVFSAPNRSDLTDSQARTVEAVVGGRDYARRTSTASYHQHPAANGCRTYDSANQARLDAAPGYESLAAILDAALEQAQAGKGKERHACGEPFEDQQIVQLGEWMGSTAFAIGQACKKALESTRLEPDRARGELLGAINYLAGAVISLERITAKKT